MAYHMLTSPSLTHLPVDAHRALEDNARELKSIETSEWPTWLSEYVEWHKKVRQDPTLFENASILVVDQGVGGLGDRLKSLPFFLWMAAKHKRLLMIYWDGECQIQEFLQPSTFDWRINVAIDKDDILAKAVRLNRIGDTGDYFHHLIDDAELESHNADRVLQAFGNHQSLTKGLALVVKDSNNDRRVLEYAFSSLFRLADPVQQLMDKTKNELGLDGKDYIGVHFRARYPGISKILSADDKIDTQGITNVTKEVKDELTKLGSHAIQCTRLAYGDGNMLVYFASDTLLAMEIQHQLDEKIVYLSTDEERLHFSYGRSSCSARYPALIDLWIMSEAQCIGVGVGGFSMLASMMNGFKCYTFHQFNYMVKHAFSQENNFFRGEDGNVPECYLPEAEEK